MWLFRNTEGFVNETQARSDIITTFVTISIVFFGMLIAFLLIWSYNKSDKMFLIVFSGIVAIYAIITVIFIAIIRSNITSTQFRVFMISSVFMALLSIIILIIFVIKSTYLFQNIDISNTRPVEPLPVPREKSVSPSPPQYVQPELNYDYDQEDRDRY